jgi:excisionase family DNA binding protein
MALMDTTDRITASIGEFCKLAGIGRSLVYEMIGDGRLDSITIGKRRLIVLDSYRRLVERQRAPTPPPQTKGKARVTAQA